MFGIKLLGDSSQTIIGDDYSVLTQKWKGRIAVTHRPGAAWFHGTHARGDYWYRLETPSYGYCEVMYPDLIRTEAPPLVFATPTAAASNKGIGVFNHVGSPGAWLGFTCVVTSTLFCTSSSPMTIGFDSGWDYRVCVFGDPRNAPPPAFGMKVMREDTVENFNSAWPLVPFRNLLSAWQVESFTRNYSIETHWGSRNVNGDADDVLAKGHHLWPESQALGFLLSGVSFINTTHDTGKTYSQGCAVTVGFEDISRNKLWSVMHIGRSQHPSGSIAEMNKWTLLTADFSYVQ